MKQVLIYTVALLLTLHLLAVAGFLGWLRFSHRLDRDRVHRVYEIFKPTVEQEKKELAEAARVKKEAEERAAEIAKLNKTAAGPLTLEDRIHAEGEKEDIAQQRYERLQRETADLTHQLETAKVLLNQQKAELDAQRKAFTEAAAREEKLRADQNFQQTVEMYEQLKAPQVKSMFQDLLKQGKSREVLDYLASMQQRKAAAVLKEFKSPEEVVQATDLMERLRARGSLPAATRPQPTENPT